MHHQQRPPGIPLGLLNNLVCQHCKNFLSCGRVFVVQNGGSLCGRCLRYSRPDYPNVVYEQLAQLFTYPCKNWNRYCNKSLAWNECLNHEDGCGYGKGCGYCCCHPMLNCSSPRELPRVEPTEQYDIPDQLMAFFQCSLCEHFLSSEGCYISQSGQSICQKCVSSPQAPPNLVLNHNYQVLASIFRFPCKNRKSGCPMKGLFGNQILYHELECPYGNQTKLTYSKLKSNEPQPKEAPQQPKKERGIIHTVTGAHYATITQNTNHLFAVTGKRPPANNELIKSLKNKQERRIARIDQDSPSYASSEASYSGTEESKPSQRPSNDSGWQYQPQPIQAPLFEQNYPQPNYYQKPQRSSTFRNEQPKIHVPQSNSFQQPRRFQVPQEQYLAGHAPVFYPSNQYHLDPNDYNYRQGHLVERTESQSSLSNPRLVAEIKARQKMKSSVNDDIHFVNQAFQDIDEHY